MGKLSDKMRLDPATKTKYGPHTVPKKQFGSSRGGTRGGAVSLIRLHDPMGSADMSDTI